MDAPPPLPPEIRATLPPAVVVLIDYLLARVALLEAKLADTESRLANTQAKLADTESKLANTQAKLADTESKLANTQAKLADTESRLADTQAKLATVEAKLADTQAKLADTETKLADAQARLAGKKTPNNSSLPPSSTHPHDKPVDAKPKSPRKRGGQPGHAKHERALIPVDQCQQVVPCIPAGCRRCGHRLGGLDPQPWRHQVWELPEFRPIVIEYQRHRLACICGTVTCGELPAGVPTGQAGPRLVSFAALLMACFRQSKRRAAQFLSIILHQPASPGWMVGLQNLAAQAVRPAYNELVERLPEEPRVHADESPTKQGKLKAWVWTFVAATYAVFVCATSRAATVVQEILGEDYDGVVQCDRARMYWGFGRLQWCWAHLKRDFQAWTEDPCPEKQKLGRDLMKQTKKMFGLWKKVRDGTMSRRRFRHKMKPLRRRVELVLVRAFVESPTENLVRELLERSKNLWTFVDVEGVEPTNNAAEQALRHAVIWRKLSFGTQSASGSRFVERLLTVIETCRRQDRNVYEWLTESIQAFFNGANSPSLLPTP